jgi:Cdc6-like AAA superfamily ATPase
MPVDPFIPIGYALPAGHRVGRVLVGEEGWQIYENGHSARVLIAEKRLVDRWLSSGLIENGTLEAFGFGLQELYALASGANYRLEPVAASPSPASKSEALAFATALKQTRELDAATPLQDAIYAEKLSRLLPSYSLSSPKGDDIVLGSYLTGGIEVSVYAGRRFRAITNWLPDAARDAVVEAAGLSHGPGRAEPPAARVNFQLPGRRALERFFTEHVLDIIADEARYQKFGIAFPGPIILHGPPGCGKTFAVEKLGQHVGWPSFHISAATIASPYIHETSRKIAALFDEAIANAPAIIVIDEMEGFLTSREIAQGSGQHHIEEMAEFLKRIPEAPQHKVLIIAMTNRIEMIDPAILRRGRFDHVIKVEMPDAAENLELLQALLAPLPKAEDIAIERFAASLTGRPLSDAAFIVREAARLSAREGHEMISQESLTRALASAPGRDREDPSRRIGFQP